MVGRRRRMWRKGRSSPPDWARIGRKAGGRGYGNWSFRWRKWAVKAEEEAMIELAITSPMGSKLQYRLLASESEFWGLEAARAALSYPSLHHILEY
ncbi:hypothetical protein HPP92_016422 [Vanilla planifolia]|uniref:Uncharacterized protein n=1 Tax=Vanilla planifolia TaxID=51239 RepID=A0A835QER0_VANPL|nr:hypothetical protein HPP92_016422 [Vanilla planifolia]